MVRGRVRDDFEDDDERPDRLATIERALILLVQEQRQTNHWLNAIAVLLGAAAAFGLGLYVRAHGWFG